MLKIIDNGYIHIAIPIQVVISDETKEKHFYLDELKSIKSKKLIINKNTQDLIHCALQEVYKMETSFESILDHAISDGEEYYARITKYRGKIDFIILNNEDMAVKNAKEK